MRLLESPNLPKNWQLKRIGEFVVEYRGGAPLKPSDFSKQGFPVIPKKAIRAGGLLNVPEDSQTYCTQEFADTYRRSVVDNRYLITTLRDLVPTGPAIGYVTKFDGVKKYILSQGVYGFILVKELHGDFLIHLSNTQLYRRVMQKIMVGSTQVHIRTGEYFDTEIPLPPLPEQHKIAEILSTWNKAIELVGKQIEAKQRLKKGLMQQLLTGKMRFAGFDREWREGKVKHLAKLLVSNVDKKSFPDEISVVLCNYMDVFKNEYITGEIDFMPATCTQAEIKKFLLQIGDVLLTKDSETREDIASTTVVIETLDNLVCGYHLAILRPDPQKVSSVFLAKLLSHGRTHHHFVANANGATRFGLTISAIENTIVFVPNIDEQKRIEEVFLNLDGEIKILNRKIGVLRKQKQGLMQKLLTGEVRVKV